MAFSHRRNLKRHIAAVTDLSYCPLLCVIPPFRHPANNSDNFKGGTVSGDPPLRGGVCLLCSIHYITEHLAVGGRRPGDSICTGFDSRKDRLACRSSRCDNRNVRVTLAYFSYNICGLACGGYVEYLCTCLKPAFNILVFRNNRNNYGNINSVTYLTHNIIRCRAFTTTPIAP